MGRMVMTSDDANAKTSQLKYNTKTPSVSSPGSSASSTAADACLPFGAGSTTGVGKAVADVLIIVVDVAVDVVVAVLVVVVV